MPTKSFNGGDAAAADVKKEGEGKSQPFEILSRYRIQLHFKLMKSLYNDSTLFTLKTNKAKETVTVYTKVYYKYISD